jgi:hypothetical protein
MSFSYGHVMTPGKRDPMRKPYQPLKITPGWVIGMVLVALAAGDVLWRMLQVVQIRLPYGMTDALVLAVAFGYRVAVAVHGPPEPFPPAPSAPTTEMSDRPFTAIRRWEDRLAWTHDDAVSFDRTVRERLAALVDERLRIDHGTDLAGAGPGGTQRVRALLGDPLWTLLTEPTERAPSRAQLTESVRTMERLFAQDGGNR